MPRALPHPLPDQERPIAVKGALVLGPTPELSQVRTLGLAGGRFVPPGELGADAAELDAKGLVAAPGLIDLHVHLREPGFEHKETIATGTRAAVEGGFTTLCAMPNTKPPIDSTELLDLVRDRARAAGLARVYQYAAITRGQGGQEPCDFAELVAAGCVGFSDDGLPVDNPRLMRDALVALDALDRPAMIHAEERVFAPGPIHEGVVSKRLGICGIDPLAEELMTLRDCYLAEVTGARIHICHVSTARAAEIVRRAKARGVRVTAEACPHHLILADEAMGDGKNADYKMNPPLRTAADVAALRTALTDGTIDAIASDHAPHTAEEKARGLAAAPFGIVGLETTLPLVLTHLVATGVLLLEEAIARMSAAPARILDLPVGRIEDGAPADLVLIDLDEAWTIRKSELSSKSANTPFDGTTVRGRAAATLVGGRLVAIRERHRARLGP